jgi:hypothetical protein
MAAGQRREISDDDDGGDVVGRDIDKVAKRARQLQRDDDEPAPQPRRRADETEIDLDDDDEDDEDDEDEDELDVKPTRKQKKSARFRQAQEDAREARERATRLEQEIARLSGGMQFLAQRVTQPQQAPQPQGKSQHDTDIEVTRERIRSLREEYARLDPQKTSQAEIDKYHERHAALEEDLTKARFAKYAQEQGLRPVNPQAEQRNQMRNALLASHPELHNNQRLMRTSTARYNLLTAEGAPENLSTWNKAILEAKKAAGVGEFAGGAQPGRKQDASRYSGVPRGQGRTSRDTDKSSGGKFVMTAEYKGMAENAFPKLAPAKAWSKWAKTVGVKMRAQKMG